MDDSGAIAGMISTIGDSPMLDGEVQRLRSLAAPLVKPRTRRLLSGAWMGQALHPMLTDIPIGCWTSAALLDLVGGRPSRRAAQRLIGVGLLAVPLVALAGTSDWRSSDDTEVQRVGVVHAAANSAAAVAYWRSWVARRRGLHGRGLVWGALGALSASAGGHLGGHLAHGTAASGPVVDEVDVEAEVAA